MTTPAYHVGAPRRLQASFEDIDGNAADPTTVQLVVRQGDGAEISKTYAAGELTRSALGVFYYDFDITVPRRHIARWIATGAVKAVADEEFYALPKQVTT